MDEKNTTNKIEYPADHKVGMVVPKGGSDCEKCEYRDGQNCKNKYFNQAVGKTIPAPVDEYCCDFFEASDAGDSDQDEDNDDDSPGQQMMNMGGQANG